MTSAQIPRTAVALMLALAAGSYAPAFDFNRLGEALKKIDVDKAIDIGKRVKESMTELPLEEEIVLGRDLAARLLSAVPPADDLELQAYVARLGRWLALQTRRADLPWQFTAVDTDTVGAFATPGGQVVITTGLMRLLRDEDELAGVLAHEIAHVVDEHHVKAIMARARVDLAKDAAKELAGEYLDGHPQITQSVLNAGVGVLSSGLDKADELAADQLGVVIAARAGYDPLGLLYALATLDSIAADEPRLELMFSTHPPTTERIDALLEAAETLAARYASALRDRARFERIHARLLAQTP